LDFRAAPLLAYSFGPLALTAQTGLSYVRELEAIGTPEERTLDHFGVLAVGGIAGVL